jgi:hypothetical protein
MKQISLVVRVCALIWFIFLPLLGEAILFSPAPGRALLELGVLALAGILIVWGLMRVQGGSTPISSQPDEQEVDHWFLIYLPTGGGRFGVASSGDLKVVLAINKEDVKERSGRKDDVQQKVHDYACGRQLAHV